MDHTVSVWGESQGPEPLQQEQLSSKAEPGQCGVCDEFACRVVEGSVNFPSGNDKSHCSSLLQV